MAITVPEGTAIAASRAHPQATRTVVWRGRLWPSGSLDLSVAIMFWQWGVPTTSYNAVGVRVRSSGLLSYFGTNAVANTIIDGPTAVANTVYTLTAKIPLDNGTTIRYRVWDGTTLTTGTLVRVLDQSTATSTDLAIGHNFGSAYGTAGAANLYAELGYLAGYVGELPDAACLSLEGGASPLCVNQNSLAFLFDFQTDSLKDTVGGPAMTVKTGATSTAPPTLRVTRPAGFACAA